MIINFEQIQTDIAEAKQLLQLLVNQQSENVSTSREQELFSVTQCAEFLSLSPQTIYSKISKNELPVIKHPSSKRCYFLKEDLINYLKGMQVGTQKGEL